MLSPDTTTGALDDSTTGPFGRSTTSSVVGSMNPSADLGASTPKGALTPAITRIVVANKRKVVAVVDTTEFLFLSLLLRLYIISPSAKLEN